MLCLEVFCYSSSSFQLQMPSCQDSFISACNCFYNWSHFKLKETSYAVICQLPNAVSVNPMTAVERLKSLNWKGCVLCSCKCQNKLQVKQDRCQVSYNLYFSESRSSKNRNFLLNFGRNVGRTFLRRRQLLDRASGQQSTKLAAGKLRKMDLSG